MFRNNTRLRLIVKLPTIAISAVLLAFVGLMGFCYLSDDYSAYIVLSDSMQPTFSSGDLVFVGPPNRLFVDDIKPDSIIMYQHNEALVTHRVVAIEGDALVTKGDAMEDPDPWSVSRSNDVKGSYITHIPYIGKFNSFIRTKMGWFVTIILPAVFLLGLIIKEIIKEAYKEEPGNRSAKETYETFKLTLNKSMEGISAAFKMRAGKRKIG